MATDILSSLLEKATDVQLEDFIAERMLKAESLSACTFGDTGAGFRGMNDTLQDNFLWALGDMLREANEARDEVTRRRYAAGRSVVDIQVIGKTG